MDSSTYQFLINFDTPALAGIDYANGSEEQQNLEDRLRIFLYRELPRYLQSRPNPDVKAKQSDDKEKSSTPPTIHRLDLQESLTFSDETLNYFADYLDTSEKVLNESRNLQAAVVWTICQGVQNGIAGFCEGLQVIQSQISDCWDELYPSLEAGKRDPAIQRFNTLYPLVMSNDADYRVTNLLYRLPVVIGKKGEIINGRGLFVAQGLQDSYSVGPTPVETSSFTGASIDGLLSSVDEQRMEQTIKQLKSAMELTRVGGGLSSLYNELTKQANSELNGKGSWEEINFSAVFEHLEFCLNTLKPFDMSGAADETLEETSAVMENAVGQDALIGNGNSVANGVAPVRNENPVVSRELAEKSIKSVFAYYHSYEESNPALIFVAYACKLLGKSFIEIVSLLIPGDESISSKASKLTEGFEKLILQQSDKDISVVIGDIEQWVGAQKSESMDVHRGISPNTELSVPQVSEQTQTDPQIDGNAESSMQLATTEHFDSSAEPATNTVNMPDTATDTAVGSTADDATRNAPAVESDANSMPDTRTTFRNTEWGSEVSIVSDRARALWLTKCIVEFFEVMEPTSPVPMLLRKSIRVANMDFMSALNDLSGNQPETVSSTPESEEVEADV